MDFITVLGLLAALLTIMAFVPQVIKTWKTKSTRDISLAMFAVMCASLFLWLVYGLLINSLPLILSNLITFVLALVILLHKIRYK